MTTPATAIQVEALLSPPDLAALQRLNECLEDDEDHDVPKDKIQRLVELGFARHHGFGRHSVTSIGKFALGSWGRTPLQTYSDSCQEWQDTINARSEEAQ